MCFTLGPDPQTLEILSDLRLEFSSKGKEKVYFHANLNSLSVNLRGGHIDHLPILRPSDLELHYDFGSNDVRSHTTIVFKLNKIVSTLTMTSLDLIQKQIQVPENETRICMPREYFKVEYLYDISQMNTHTLVFKYINIYFLAIQVR